MPGGILQYPAVIVPTDTEVSIPLRQLTAGQVITLHVVKFHML